MIKKLLCVGNNSTDTDQRAQKIAQERGLEYHGLLSDLDSVVDLDSYKQPGVYHTSIFDLEFGKMIAVANGFDLVIMLNQPKEQWTHPDAFYNTIRALAVVSVTCEFQDPGYRDSIRGIENLVKNNKSFCVFPFIELLVNYDHTTVCCRSSTPVAKYTADLDFKNHPRYQSIRESMINGKLLPDHCGSCYKLESQGIVSARQQETVEWCNRLSVTDIADLDKIVEPAYYEIRASNKCNLMCRMCRPGDSHLIANEYQRLGLFTDIHRVEPKNSHGFEIIKFDNLRKVYVAGGEPTLLPELYDFLDRCIEQDRRDIEILINTNGTKLSERFKKQMMLLPGLHFIISVDGHSRINDYIRWNSDWNTIVDNWRWLVDHGKSVTVNSTFSIWNIAHMHELYEFIDQEFKVTAVHAQLAEGQDFFHVKNYPRRDLALKSLKRITATRCYANDPAFASFVDGLYLAFENKDKSFDQDRLRSFFNFNDSLDCARGVRLADYLPELDLCRQLVYTDTQ